MPEIGPEYLTRLLNQHGGALVLFAAQWCHAPEDVVQEALLKLMRQRRPPDNAVAWLYRVVRNGAISQSRSETRRAKREAVVAEREQSWFNASPETLIDATQAAESLKQLPLDQRETIVARLWGGLSFREIARLTGTTRSTAHRRYVQGLSALHDELSAPPIEDERTLS